MDEGKSKDGGEEIIFIFFIYLIPIIILVKKGQIIIPKTMIITFYKEFQVITVK